MKKTKRSKFWNTMVNILDNQFPKGKCKERGRALVMLSYIEMLLRGYKFDKDRGEPKLPDKKKRFQFLRDSLKLLDSIDWILIVLIGAVSGILIGMVLVLN